MDVGVGGDNDKGRILWYKQDGEVKSLTFPSSALSLLAFQNRLKTIGIQFRLDRTKDRAYLDMGSTGITLHDCTKNVRKAKTLYSRMGFDARAPTDNVYTTTLSPPFLMEYKTTLPWVGAFMEEEVSSLSITVSGLLGDESMKLTLPRSFHDLFEMNYSRQDVNEQTASYVTYNTQSTSPSGIQRHGWCEVDLTAIGNIETFIDPVHGSVRSMATVTNLPLETNAYITCSLVNPQHVGDRILPLMEVVPLMSTFVGYSTQPGRYVYEPKHVKYYSLASLNHQTIHFTIEDEEGRPPPFIDSGVTTLTLAFKKT